MTTERQDVLKLIGGGMLLTVGSGTTIAKQEELRSRAKEIVAAKHGENVENLSIVNEARASWSTINERYYNPKVYNSEKKVTHSVLLDGNGNEVERVRLNEREKEAYEQKYGKLERKLYEKIDSGEIDGEVDVQIWLEPVDYDSVRETVGREVAFDDRNQLFDEIQSRIAEKTESFAKSMEPVSGVTVVNTSSGDTFVDARVNVKSLEAVEKNPSVKRIFEWKTEKTTQLKSVTQTVRTYSSRSSTFDASGYPIGQAEEKPDTTSNVNIGGSWWDSSGTSGHSRVVMETMASKDYYLPGTGYQADVYHADDIPSNFDSKMQWFEDNNVGGVNFSWVFDSSDREMGTWDFRYGQQVYNRGLSMVVSASKCGDNCYVATPGLGFNTTAVGGLNDKNDGDWSNDEVTGDSYKNPASKNSGSSYYPHSKPEVANVSVDVDVPSGANGGGTSVSAPAYTGMLAVLNKLSDDYGSYNFHNYPELTRAIMMAAAANDDGGSFDRLGTGVPSATAMDKIVSDAQFDFAYFNNANNNQTYDAYIGETGELRVALVWLSNVTDSDFADNRDAQSDIDLDLHIEDPNGDTLSNSVSYDRGFEWVNTSISTTGVYTFDVQKFRWDASESSREMGLAWYVA